MKPTAQRTPGQAPLLALILLVAALLPLSACGGGGGGGGGGPTDIVQYTTGQAVAADALVRVAGRWLAFLADEGTSGAGGTDFNGDGDESDSIAVAVDMLTQLEFVLNVAARDLAWIGRHLYLVVDEADDGFDWDGDGSSDRRVLLHWRKDAGVTWVANLTTAGARQVVAVGGALFFAAESSAPGPTLSAIKAIEEAKPLLPREVLTHDLTGDLSPRILGADEGLVFLGLDETLEGRDLNGDGDSGDERVLALLDGTGAFDALGYTLAIRNVALALPGPAETPFRARNTGANDWLVGFLVDESDQADTNFNDPALFPSGWQPVQCIGDEDDDTDDEVLFFLHFAAWDTDPGGSPPANTGLVGKRRVVAVGDFVGTISPEEDEGTCSLNDDGDQGDDVFRWVRATTPVLPPTAPDDLHALEGVPGGTRGAAELEGRFVIVVDEMDDGRDLNGDGFSDLDLVGWIAPADGGPFTFDHEPGAGQAFATASWVGEIPGRSRLGVAFSEQPEVDINDDGDSDDSVPTFAHFLSDPTELGFPGFGAACDRDNAGIQVQNDWAFYRISELEDGRDWTGDGDASDFLLWRTRLGDGVTHVMSILNSVGGTPAVVAQTSTAVTGTVWITNEAQAGDVNGDGRDDGLVVRYFVW